MILSGSGIVNGVGQDTYHRCHQHSAQCNVGGGSSPTRYGGISTSSTVMPGALHFIGERAVEPGEVVESKVAYGRRLPSWNASWRARPRSCVPGSRTSCTVTMTSGVVRKAPWGWCLDRFAQRVRSYKNRIVGAHPRMNERTSIVGATICGRKRSRVAQPVELAGSNFWHRISGDPVEAGNSAINALDYCLKLRLSCWRDTRHTCLGNQ